MKILHRNLYQDGSIKPIGYFYCVYLAFALLKALPIAIANDFPRKSKEEFTKALFEVIFI